MIQNSKVGYSSYVDTYNVHATPTFYIVDAKNKIIANPDNFFFFFTSGEIITAKIICRL